MPLHCKDQGTYSLLTYKPWLQQRCKQITIAIAISSRLRLVRLQHSYSPRNYPVTLSSNDTQVFRVVSIFTAVSQLQHIAT